MSHDGAEWLVQKYGGTSVGKFLPAITGSIIPSYIKHNRVAVVCSAISGSEKETGTTSLLSKAVDLANEGRHEEVEHVIDLIQAEHLRLLDTLDASIANGSAEARKEIEVECCRIKSRLSFVQTEVATVDTRDRIISTGENLACIVVVAALKANRITSKLISLHDIVASAYGPDARFHQSELSRLGPRFFHPLATQISKLVQACEAEVPVVTGCFGSVPNSLISSVGKGYSDFCAALCASGLNARELQIWKEVDGVFTADPRKIKSARLLPTLTMEEARELTHYGSQVIHPFTMDQLRHGGIPLRLKNVLRPDGDGTIIYPSPATSGSNTPSFATGPLPSVESDPQSLGKPTAITSKSLIVLVNILSNREAKSLRFLADVFRRLDDLDAIVDLSTSSEQSVSVALSIERNDDLVPILAGLETCGKVEVLSDMAIIAVIGQKMKSTIGVAAQIFSVLAQNGVNIYFIGQGATEINISVVVRQSDVIVAMDKIHTQVLGIPHQNDMMKGLVIGPWLF